MQGLSFREYLCIETNIDFKTYTLNEIISNHQVIVERINSKIKVFKYFEPYLKSGYYPFYRESPKLYHIKLGEVVNMILDIELSQLRQIDVAYIPKLKQLLAIIARSVPFKPNVSKLSDKIGLNRQTLLSYLNYLDEAALTYHLYKPNTGISQLQKPDKLFLENTNLMFLLVNDQANKGNLRETFFVNQLSYKHRLNYAEKADFLVDNTYTFEIGDKDKTQYQIKDTENAYIAADDIVYGFQNKIPLWLFGFLY
jgi:predicted AAA+ superfamily ATPase